MALPTIEEIVKKRIDAGIAGDIEEHLYYGDDLDDGAYSDKAKQRLLDELKATKALKTYRVMFVYEAGGAVTVRAKSMKDAERQVYEVINDYDHEQLRRTAGMEGYEVYHRDFRTDDETVLVK